MIRLQVEPIDVSEISLLLAKHFVSAKVTEREIIFNDEPSVQLLYKLCDAVKILGFDNSRDVVDFSSEECLFEDNPNLPLEEDMLTCEVSGEEKVIIEESLTDLNLDNTLSEETKQALPTENINNDIFKKSEARSMSHEFDPSKIHASGEVLELLAYCRNPIKPHKGKNKKAHKTQDFTCERSKKEREELMNAETSKLRNDILSYVNEEELRKLVGSKVSLKPKIRSILELFGFDMNRNGVEYLCDAIYFSLKKEYYNVSTLSKIVSENHGVTESEVQRLIVARVKERFGFKKAPTLEFIRIVNEYLNNKEN